jgi:hypothetical protein
MADTNEWNEARLLGLIRDKIEESHTWEYKAAGKLGRDKREKDGITKAVSGMANASGGTVIFGIAEFADEPRKYLPERIDHVDGTAFPKEWLEHVISEIEPPIPGLKVLPVRMDAGSVYVVEIPQGSTAHQATDFRYYRRRNFEVLPMLDHEVRDVMNRHSHPKIEVSARLVIYPHVNKDGEAGRLMFTLKNESDVLACYVKLSVNAPIKIKGRIVSYVGDWIMDDCDDGLGYILVSSNHLGAPLFPRSQRVAAFDFKLVDQMQMRELKPLSEFYNYTVYADSMPAIRGKFATDQIFEQILDPGDWKLIANV